jgi:hypothetical protein
MPGQNETAQPLRNSAGKLRVQTIRGAFSPGDAEMTARNGLMIPFVLCALILGIGDALGQESGQERAACRQDVKRFCQAELQRNPDDVLSITNCLQTNRARISRTCRHALASHGQ